MIGRLYLGDAFGWDSEATAKVAISQLREAGIIKTSKCPKAQLIKNEPYRWMSNLTKTIGYLPLFQIIAGVAALTQLESSPELDPNHVAKWKCRCVGMILGGPLLFVVDLIKYIHDRVIAYKYNRKYPHLIDTFNTKHEHSPANYPGHPIFCKDDKFAKEFITIYLDPKA